MQPQTQPGGRGTAPALLVSGRIAWTAPNTCLVVRLNEGPETAEQSNTTVRFRSKQRRDLFNRVSIGSTADRAPAGRHYGHAPRSSWSMPTLPDLKAFRTPWN